MTMQRLSNPGQPGGSVSKYSLLALAWVLAALPLSGYAAATCYDSATPHPCLSNDKPVAACSDTLKADPYNLAVRFALCDAHLQRGAPLMALIVLDHGLQLCGRSEANCSRLQNAITEVERTSAQQPGSADLRAEHAENRTTCVRRHIRGDPIYPAILACEQALIAFPEDADLHAAHGEKLLISKQPARAVLAFRRALTIRPGDANFLSWHDAAEDARQTMVERCLQHTELDRCNRAILPGTRDEAQLHRHRSNLYLQQGNTAAALESLLIVQIIEPDDRQVSQQLLQLLPAGAQIGDDRLYLPRGQARLARGDLAAAITDLRRASRRQLDRSAAQAALQQARQQRAVVVQSQCFDARNSAACSALLLAGEPDEQKIRGFIDSLSQPAARPAVAATVQSAVSVKPAAIAVVSPASANPGPADSNAATPGSNRSTTPPDLPAAAQTAAYSNRASTQGRTH